MVPVKAWMFLLSIRASTLCLQDQCRMWCVLVVRLFMHVSQWPLATKYNKNDFLCYRVSLNNADVWTPLAGRSELLRLTRHVELMVQVENLFRSRLVPKALQEFLLRSIAIIDKDRRPTVSVYPNSAPGFVDFLFLFLSRTLGMRRLLIKFFEMFFSGFIEPEAEPSLPRQLIASVLDVALREHELDKRERLQHLRSLQLVTNHQRTAQPPSAPSSHAAATRVPSVIRPGALAGRASWRWTFMSEADGDDDPPDFLHQANPAQPPCSPMWTAPPRTVLPDPNMRLEELKCLVLNLQTRMEQLTRQVQDHITHTSRRDLDVPTAAPSTETVNEVIV